MFQRRKKPTSLVAARQISADDTAAALENIRRLMGSETLLADIDSNMIASAERRRAAEPVMRRGKAGNRKKLVRKETG